MVQRHPNLVNKNDIILIIIDVQEKLIPKIFQKDLIIKNIIKIIQFSKMLNIQIVLTEQYPKGLGHTIPEIKENLTYYEPIEKVSFSCFGSSEFATKISEIEAKTLVIAGIETHICVNQTALDAIFRNFKVHVISDAVSSRTKENWETGICKMRDNDVVISSTEMFIYEILEKAGTDNFKKCLPLLK